MYVSGFPFLVRVLARCEPSLHVDDPRSWEGKEPL